MSPQYARQLLPTDDIASDSAVFTGTGFVLGGGTAPVEGESSAEESKRAFLRESITMTTWLEEEVRENEEAENGEGETTGRAGCGGDRRERSGGVCVGSGGKREIIIREGNRMKGKNWDIIERNWRVDLEIAVMQRIKNQRQVWWPFNPILYSKH